MDNLHWLCPSGFLQQWTYILLQVRIYLIENQRLHSEYYTSLSCVIPIKEENDLLKTAKPRVVRRFDTLSQNFFIFRAFAVVLEAYTSTSVFYHVCQNKEQFIKRVNSPLFLYMLCHLRTACTYFRLCVIVQYSVL